MIAGLIHQAAAAVSVDFIIPEMYIGVYKTE
jgi:hypothetical protein